MLHSVWTHKHTSTGRNLLLLSDTRCECVRSSITMELRRWKKKSNTSEAVKQVTSSINQRTRRNAHTHVLWKCVSTFCTHTNMGYRLINNCRWHTHGLSEESRYCHFEKWSCFQAQRSGWQRVCLPCTGWCHLSRRKFTPWLDAVKLHIGIWMWQ